MPEAARTLPPAPHLAQARAGVIRPELRHFHAGVFVPNAYGCQLRGDCCKPELSDGDMVLASPSATPQVGDFVVLHHAKPGRTPWLKRLMMAPMVPVGTALHPDSTVQPVVGVETLNPPRMIFIPTGKLSAMHAVVGVIPKVEVDAQRAAAKTATVARRPRRVNGGAA